MAVEEPAVEAPPVAEPEAVEAPTAPRFGRRFAIAGQGPRRLGGYWFDPVRKVDAQTWTSWRRPDQGRRGRRGHARDLDELVTTAKAEAIQDPEVLLDRLKSQLKSMLVTGDRTLRDDRAHPTSGCSSG